MAIEQTSLALNVASPLGMQIELEVESVQLPVVTGEIGVLPGHVPLLAALKPGVLRYKLGGQTQVAAIGRGFVEADASRVRVITEFFARAEDIQVDKARAELAEVNSKLKASTAALGEPEQVALQLQLEWAQAQLEVAGATLN